MVFAPADLAPDEAGLFQGANVLRNRVKRHVKGLRQRRDGRTSLPQPGEDRPARGVTEHRESSVEASVSIFNHMVEYYRPRYGPSREKWAEALTKDVAGRGHELLDRKDGDGYDSVRSGSTQAPSRPRL